MTEPQPNILLVHVHDLGRWLGCYGDASIQTPNLDALASEGIRFDRAFAVAPLCSPARGSLFTGLYPHEHGVTGLAHRGHGYAAGVKTLPMSLREVGYQSVLIGVQHEAVDPNKLGFDRLVGHGYPPRALFVADFAAEWLRTEAPADIPFLLTAGMWEPHRPWRPEDYPSDDPATVQIPGWLPDNEHTRADIAAFHGAIRQMDTAVGTILTALDDSSRADDTLVVFTTDHGSAFPGGKGTLYDPGIEVSLIVRPPRGWRASTSTSDALVSHLDVHRTLLDVAGASTPRESDGRSFAALMRGRQAHAVRSRLFAEKSHHDGYDPIRCIRTDRWKYIRNFEPGPRLVLSKDLASSETLAGYGDDYLQPRAAEELYDLENDPFERANLSSDPSLADVRDELAMQLAEWMVDTNDPLAFEPTERVGP